MTIALERFGRNILDEQGDIRPLADVTDGTIPPDNSFLIGRDYTLPARRAETATLQNAADWDSIEDKNPGPFMTFEEYYTSQLELLDITSGISMRKGFNTASDFDEKIATRYQERLPIVIKGAKHKAYLLATQGMSTVYRADELERAGFDPQDITDDVNKMRAQHRLEYAGTKNESKRRRLRKKLEQKLASLAVKP